MSSKLDFAWYLMVRPMCIVRNIDIRDINPNDPKSLEILRSRIVGAI